MPTADDLPEGTDRIIEGAGAGAGEEASERADETRDEDLEEDRSAGKPQDARGPQAQDTGKQQDDGDQLAGGSLFDRVDALRGQAGDKARDFVQTGKDRAVAALDDVVRMIEDAAGEIDDKLGANYGDYARRAAEGIGSFSETFKDKDVDELFADARELVRKSPGVAIGGAAALGFVVARIVRAGMPGGTSTPARDAGAA